MPHFKVTFYQVKHPENIQREKISADSPDDLYEIYANTGCEILDINPAETAYNMEHGQDEEREIGGITQWVGQEPVSNHDLLVRSGVVNADGSLKPYIATGHNSRPLEREDVTDFFGEEQ